MATLAKGSVIRIPNPKKKGAPAIEIRLEEEPRPARTGRGALVVMARRYLLKEGRFSPNAIPHTFKEYEVIA